MIEKQSIIVLAEKPIIQKDNKKDSTYKNIGIDGIKKGWLAVYLNTKNEFVKYRALSTITKITDDMISCPILIDMPIGYPPGKLERDCDKLARKYMCMPSAKSGQVNTLD